MNPNIITSHIQSGSYKTDLQDSFTNDESVDNSSLFHSNNPTLTTNKNPNKRPHSTISDDAFYKNEDDMPEKKPRLDSISDSDSSTVNVTNSGIPAPTDDDLTIGKSNKDIEAKNYYLGGIIELPSKDETKYFEEAGDSNEDDFDDYDLVEDVPNLKIRHFSIDGTVKSEYTTILANDGRLKGNTLIKTCHTLIKEAYNREHSNRNLFSDKEEIVYKFEEASDWVFNLGALAMSNSLSEINRNYIIAKYLTIGQNGIELEMVYNDDKNTERMWLSDEFFKQWNESFPKSKLPTRNLKYADINRINQHIIYFLQSVDPNFSDSSLAKIQLQRLKFQEQVTWGNKVCAKARSKKGQEENFGQKLQLIKQYLDFLNALIFGLEASRVNVTLITGVMMLELLQVGHLTYKEAFFQSANWGGQFPLASIGTGRNNFGARRTLLNQHDDIGMRTDRQYPKWLAVTCKEAIIIKNWFNMKLGESTKNFSVAELTNRFITCIEDLINNTYNVSFTRYDRYTIFAKWIRFF
ncbi:MAG: hypothetical protein ACK5Z5_09060 [Neisseriaceae bacterium]